MNSGWDGYFVNKFEEDATSIAVFISGVGFYGVDGFGIFGEEFAKECAQCKNGSCTEAVDNIYVDIFFFLEFTNGERVGEEFADKWDGNAIRTIDVDILDYCFCGLVFYFFGDDVDIVAKCLEFFGKVNCREMR